MQQQQTFSDLPSDERERDEMQHQQAEAATAGDHTRQASSGKRPATLHLSHMSPPPPPEQTADASSSLSDDVQGAHSPVPGAGDKLERSGQSGDETPLAAPANPSPSGGSDSSPTTPTTQEPRREQRGRFLGQGEREKSGKEATFVVNLEQQGTSTSSSDRGKIPGQHHMMLGVSSNAGSENATLLCYI